MAGMRKSKLNPLDAIGRLTLLQRFKKSIGASGKIESFWYAICECGETKVARACSISSGYTSSCGCFRKEASINALKICAKVNTKYARGDVKSALFSRWKGILHRCLYINEHDKNYKIYAGKGVTVCDEWRNDFYAFKQWAESNGFDLALTIDRIDADKSYSPDNCQWITLGDNLKKRRLYSGPRPWLIGNKHGLKNKSEVG